MTRIAISPAAFDAIKATPPLGSVGFEPEPDAKGERLVWLAPTVVDRLTAMRRPDESYYRMLGLAAGAALTLMAFLSPLSRPAFANDAEPPWGVLIAGSFSKEAALAAVARVERAHADVIGGMHPFVCTTLRSGWSRPFYRVRLGAQSFPEAERLCSQLKAAGGACVVLRDCE